MTNKSLHFIIAIFVIISAFACSNKQVHRKQLSDKSFQTLQMDSVFTFTESDEVAFQHISSMKTDGHGHIIVHDFRQPFLFMFDREENVLQKIGRKGKGPGEFEQINSFMVTPNHLWIMGSHAVKIELFEYKHAVYQHVHTINLGSRKLAGLFLGKTDKGILIRKEVIIRANRKDNPVKAGITLINKNGEIIHDSILKVPFQEQLTVHHSGNTLTTGKSYGNRSLLAFDGNCIYTLWTDSLSIDRYSLNGDHRKAFSYPLSPVKITDKEKEEVLNKYPAIFRDALQRGLPDVKPVVNKFIIDDQHRIWMDLLTERLGKGWFCFTEEGKPLYKINIPRPGAELQEISGDLVLWNYRNEDGAPTIAVSKLKTEEM